MSQLPESISENSRKLLYDALDKRRSRYIDILVCYQQVLCDSGTWEISVKNNLVKSNVEHLWEIVGRYQGKVRELKGPILWFFRWGNWDKKKGSDFPKATQDQTQGTQPLAQLSLYNAALEYCQKEQAWESDWPGFNHSLSLYFPHSVSLSGPNTT